MDLAEIRIKLDEIDKQIENLFEERMRLCGEVAEFKIRTGKPVYDAKREQEKIEALTGMAEGDFNKQAVGELFLQMMTLSRRYQYQTMAGRIGLTELGFQKVSELDTADVLHFRALPELMGMQPPFSISEKTRTSIMSADLKI